MKRSGDDDEDGPVKRICPDDNGTNEGVTEQEEEIIAVTTDPAMLNDHNIFSHDLTQQDDGIIQQHMNITQPLAYLRQLLEDRLSINLGDYSFWLQDSQELDQDKNLVDQCVQGEGMVQVNIELLNRLNGDKRINIVDVLKPAEDFVEMTEQFLSTGMSMTDGFVDDSNNAVPSPEESNNVTRWIVSPEFKQDKERLKIPEDPGEWTEDHVHHWITWAFKQFSLESVDMESWKIAGKELCSMTHEEFTQRVPLDQGDIFWTHVELLRKCKIVAVVQPPNSSNVPATVKMGRAIALKGSRAPKIGLPRIVEGPQPGNRSGNNGQIQLWQFLLELLTDKNQRDIIQWLGADGEFKLINPEMVASMWGRRKNKPTMNYEKLSRALRYYYDGDMISKVHGKRFVYKFVCDLKNLLGYSAEELNQLVHECAEKMLLHCNNSLNFQHTGVIAS